jgi:restriction system protein
VRSLVPLSKQLWTVAAEDNIPASISAATFVANKTHLLDSWRRNVPKERERADENIFEILADLPWWVSIVFGLIVYVLLQFGLTFIWRDVKSLPGIFATTLSKFSWLAVFFVVPSLVSVCRSVRKRRQLDRQSGIDTIRTLSWKEFEDLLGEAYRRQGFTVFENTGIGADGGIDLTIKKAGETYLVQCKHWKTYKVGVKVVREMLGLVTAHGATGAIVVTSGVFTKEAVDFAAVQGIQLVDGVDLFPLIQSVQSQPMMVAPAPTLTVRSCPACGSRLVLKLAKRGPTAGNQFWGCTNFPNCRHTETFAG